jgi:hypothetical protein
MEVYSDSPVSARSAEIFSSVMPVSAWSVSYPIAWICSWLVAAKALGDVELLAAWPSTVSP